MPIIERKHRLPKQYNQGKVTDAFTICIKGNNKPFINSDIIKYLSDMLASCVIDKKCFVPVYCFMPDHLHLIISGTSDDSDVWKAIVLFKQKTGYWMSKSNKTFKWQKDFYDHVIKNHEQLAVQVRYILDNPVRQGLVKTWKDYPFHGAIGCAINDALHGIV